MEAILRGAASYEDLIRIQDPHYRFDAIFGGEGLRVRSLNKSRFKLLKQLDAQLRKMLAPDERVEYVSWGTHYSFAEAYFMGLWSYLLNRRALVLTDRRLLVLQINSRRKLMDLKAQVRYEAIAKVARASFGYLTLIFHDTSRMNLTGIPGRDRKALRELIERHRAERQSEQRVAGAENLCPHCYTPVVGFPDACRECGGGFKSGIRAGWFSLLLPGLGDAYLGHRGLAAIEILGALCVWGVIASAGLDAGREEGGALATLAVIGVLGVPVFVFLHGIDAWITRRTGMKGIYPARRGNAHGEGSIVAPGLERRA